MNSFLQSFLQHWGLGELDSSLWHLAGWTMCFYLVVGTVVAVVGAMLRLVCRRAAPGVRYGVSLAVFAVLALLPIGIAGWLFQSVPAVPLSVANAEPVVPSVVELKEQIVPPSGRESLTANSSKVGDGLSHPESEDIYGGGVLVVPSHPEGGTIYGEELVASFRAVLGWLPWVWILGAPVTFLLLATGLVGSTRMRRRCEPIVSGVVAESCERLRSSLRVTRRVSVAICDRIAQPVLVGIVRPLILLPSAALTGWSPDELEMVLLHELAHVRRWDNLVNLWQRIVESVLFFHPAVWLVSRQVRRDREQCCDAIVVARTAKPQAYAELLLNIAAVSGKSATFATASALADHPLAGRVRRILNLEDEPMLVSRGTLGGFTLVVATLVAVMLWQPGTKTVAEESLTAEVAESAEEKSKTETELWPQPFYATDFSSPYFKKEFVRDQEKEIFRKTQLALIKSQHILKQVLRDKRVAEMPFLKRVRDPLHWLYTSLHVEFPNESMTMQIALEGPAESKKHLSTIIDVVIERYQSELEYKQKFVKRAADDVLLTTEDTKGTEGRDLATKNSEALPVDKVYEAGKTMVMYLPHPTSARTVEKEVRKLNRIGHNVTIRPTENGTALLVEDGVLSLARSLNDAILSPEGPPLPFAGERESLEKIIKQVEEEIVRIEREMADDKLRLQEKEEALKGKAEKLSQIDTRKLAVDVRDAELKLSMKLSMKQSDLDQMTEMLSKLRKKYLAYEKTVGEQHVRKSGYAHADLESDQGATTENGKATTERDTNDYVIDFPNAIKEGDPERIVKELAERGFEAILLEESIRDGIARKMTVKIPQGSNPRVVFEEYPRGISCRIITQGNRVLAETNTRAVYPDIHAYKPAKIVPGDQIMIHVEGEYPDQQIDQSYRVEPAGTVALGPTYGRVALAGMTLAEAEKAVTTHLGKMLADAAVQITWFARKEDSQAAKPVPQEFLTPGYRKKEIALELQYAQKVLDRMENGIDRVVEARNKEEISESEVQNYILEKDRAELQVRKLEMQLAALAEQASKPRGASATGRGSLDLSAFEAERVVTGDTLMVRVEGEFPDQPIDDSYRVQPSGTLPLGPTYGRVFVGGMTLPEAEEAVVAHLKKTLKLTDAIVQITWMEPKQKSTLLYDDKTFEEWRQMWRTELKTEKRTECIKALAAFGRAGRAEEAAKTILDVAGEYDCTYFGDDAEGKLKQSIFEQLTKLSASVWLEPLLERYQKDQKKWHGLTFHLFGKIQDLNEPSRRVLLELANSENKLSFYATLALVRVDRNLQHPETVELARRLLKGKHPTTVLELLRFARLDLLPEQFDLLFHEETNVRAWAVRILATYGVPQITPIIDRLMEVLNDPAQADRHIHAIRALSAQNSKADKRRVEKLLIKIAREGDEQLLGPSIVGLKKFMAVPHEIVLKELDGKGEIPEERMKLLDDKEKIQEIVEQEEAETKPLNEMINGGGGGFF